MSARAGSLASAPKRQRQHDRDRGWHEPPGVDAAGDERGRHRDSSDDADGCAPVVADDEVPPEMPEGPNPPHANASLLRLRIVTAENDMSTTKASTPRSEIVSPGQSTPAPSADQKMPNDVSITPT